MSGEAVAGQIASVVLAKADEIKRGDVVWAQDDSDWFKVFRVHFDEEMDRITVYRRDGSLAEFDWNALAVKVKTS